MRDEIVNELIRRCRKGEESAYGELFDEIRPDVLRILHTVVGPVQDLEDIIQTIFLELFRSLPNFRRDSKFSTWLYRLVYNVALQQIRRRRIVPGRTDVDAILESLAGTTPNPLQVSEKKEMIELVSQALDSLGPKKRTVLVLHDIEEHSLDEVAELTGVGKLTVKSRLYYARKEFAKKIRQIFILSEAKTTEAIDRQRTKKD